MRLKFGLAALFLSISVLLLQSTSFSMAKIRSDLTIAVVGEDQALIAITSWEGRTFVLQNNTDASIDIESMIVMADGGVDGSYSSMMPSEARVFTLIGDATELSDKEIQIIASWEEGRAEIISWIPPFEEVNACTEQLVTITEEEVNEDMELVELDEKEVVKCSEHLEANEEPEEGVEDEESIVEEGEAEGNEVLEEIEMNVDQEIDKEEVTVSENTNGAVLFDEETGTKESETQGTTEADSTVTDGAQIIEDKKLLEAGEIEEIDEQ